MIDERKPIARILVPDEDLIEIETVLDQHGADFDLDDGDRIIVYEEDVDWITDIIEENGFEYWIV